MLFSISDWSFHWKDYSKVVILKHGPQNSNTSITLDWLEIQIIMPYLSPIKSDTLGV